MRRSGAKAVLIGVLLAAVGVGVAVAFAVHRPSARTLVWEESFSGASGALPSSRWEFETGGAGWGNQELECYARTPANASTDGEGHLVITALHQPGHVCSDGKVNDYTSSRITTWSSFSARYGRLAMRARIPTAPGTWPAFWALGRNIQKVGWPRSGEIDVMEADGRRADQVLGSVHGPTSAGAQWYITRFGRAGVDLSRDYHVYAVDWSADELVYSIDDKPYGTITRAAVEQKGEWVFDHPFYLLVNLAVGGNLPGPPTAGTTFPQRYSIDWIRVYRASD
jgi:beta-glucanase (GH16 family)